MNRTSIENLSRRTKRIIAILVDINLCVLSVWLAYYLRLGEFIILSESALIAVYLSVLFALPIFFNFGLYQYIFRYQSLPAVLNVVQATTLYGLIYATIFTAVGVENVPRTIGVLQPILLFLLVSASRMFVRFWLRENRDSFTENFTKHRVLIYGAGAAGYQLSDAISQGNQTEVLGFLDDDARLQGSILNGHKIHDPKRLPELVRSLSINDVLLAMPSIGRERRNEIFNNLKNSDISVRTLPSVDELAQGKVKVSDVRELEIIDLLGREPVKPNSFLLTKIITKKTVLVTGAGGSIGSELCRQIIRLSPKRLLLVEQSEAALYQINRELIDSGYVTTVVPLLVSTQNKEKLKEVMDTWRPDTMFHAAAYKHVPLVEQNVVEGIKNNVFGTLTSIELAINYKVENFVLISTDKAVRPTNIMGASKRLAEMVLQAFAAEGPATKLSIVRFGNVLDSSGSVVPRFREQIKDGGPVTITDERVTRFFMTIPEAAQLVIQAGAMSKGGDVFVLDMGEPVKILELAEKMIELSGLTVKNSVNPHGDIEIKAVGLRTGEKLYEELLIEEGGETTDNERIIRANESFTHWEQLNRKLQRLQKDLAKNDIEAIRVHLKNLIEGYKPPDKIVDWIHSKK